MNDENEKPPILLVDDEPEILLSLKGLLRRQFTLHTAQSGKEALEILQQHKIHVIMTDQRMPEMTGAELLNQAQTKSADSIRMIFTGYADIKAVIDAVNNGRLYRYITKPWDPDELVETLQEAADEYARRQRRRDLLSDLAEYFDDVVKLGTQDAASAVDGDSSDRLLTLRTRIQDEIEHDKAKT
jgi:response regulator RpfG family c-di-GMP phosphodiesterase